MLKSVTITKKDTCLTYVLKRTGIDTSVEFAEDLEKEFTLIPIKETKLEVGDIIAWKKKEEFISSGTFINENGRIEQSQVFTRFHLGVVEAGHLISDLTRSANPYYIPSIRMRTISLICDDYQSKCSFPDFVIRKKEK